MGYSRSAKTGYRIRHDNDKRSFFLFEVTFYFDVFTKEMLTFQVGLRRGDRTQYIEGLVDIIKILRFQGFEYER